MGALLTKAEVTRGLETVADFNVASMRVIFETYEDVCPTPALWERAFYELMGCFQTPEDCTRAFSALDTDGNGFIDARETLGALTVYCKGHLTERMALLFDIYDLNKEKEMAFDECFLMLRRTVVGLRKIVGIAAPPEKVIHNMTKQVWRNAKKHRDVRILMDDWFSWWSSDASMRNALKMFTWKSDEQRGLPTPDHWVHTDYTKGLNEDTAAPSMIAGDAATRRSPQPSPRGPRARSQGQSSSSKASRTLRLPDV